MGWDGFDSVEVVMAVEDVFGLGISDKDAEQIRTPGQLCQYVLDRVKLSRDRQQIRCFSARAFRRLRRTMTAQGYADRQTIRPGTSLATYLPAREGRFAAWTSFGKSLKLRLPALAPPGWMQLAALGTSTFLCIAIFVWLSHLKLMAIGMIVVMLGPVSFSALILRLTRSRTATIIPVGYRTVGEISRLLVPDIIRELPSEEVVWHPREVWDVIRYIIATSAAIPTSRVHQDDKFHSGDLV